MSISFIVNKWNPIIKEKAASAYKELKRRDRASQRFQDLEKGLERQCDRDV